MSVRDSEFRITRKHISWFRREKGDSDEDLAVRNVIDALLPFLGPLDSLSGLQQRKLQVCITARTQLRDKEITARSFLCQRV